MARIRDRDTTPELRVRRLVHSLGYRYRLHQGSLPGKPDLVFASRRSRDFCSWMLLALPFLPAAAIAEFEFILLDTQTSTQRTPVTGSLFGGSGGRAGGCWWSGSARRQIHGQGGSPRTHVPRKMPGIGTKPWLVRVGPIQLQNIAALHIRFSLKEVVVGEIVPVAIVARQNPASEFVNVLADQDEKPQSLADAPFSSAMGMFFHSLHVVFGQFKHRNSPRSGGCTE